MAAQIKPHTEQQMSGLLAYSQKRVCPACGSTTFKVIESRTVAEGKRRRYACSSCDHRETRYEISAEAYDEFVKAQRIVRDLKVILSTTKDSKEQECVCYSCKFYENSDCVFGYPESGTPDASDCNYFEILKS